MPLTERDARVRATKELLELLEGQGVIGGRGEIGDMFDRVQLIDADERCRGLGCRLERQRPLETPVAMLES